MKVQEVVCFTTVFIIIIVIIIIIHIPQSTVVQPVLTTITVSLAKDLIRMY